MLLGLGIGVSGGLILRIFPEKVAGRQGRGWICEGSVPCLHRKIRSMLALFCSLVFVLFGKKQNAGPLFLLSPAAAPKWEKIT